MERLRHRLPDASHTSQRPGHKHDHSRNGRHPSPVLPHGARPLSRWDFAAYEPVLAHYLELQKQLRLADLGERETQRRWASFVDRWNRGQLPDGWYDPQMCLRAVRARARPQLEQERLRRRQRSHVEDSSLIHADSGESGEDDGWAADAGRDDGEDAFRLARREVEWAEQQRVRLAEQLPRTASSSGHDTNDDYRRTLAALQQRQRREVGGKA